ncbi:MAG TPA: response regulator transcription factor [Candidatus Acidoferrales bacterium]|jgi:DNA-binding NarL/FixJ family response regulator|nr:response regulator transcription factor [Candidatus Acidoferrales bacterium]
MNTAVADKIRVLLIDDHTLFRESLARLLQSEPGLEVVGHCSSSVDALQAISERAIDIVLLDLDLGTEKGADLLGGLREAGFAGKVLLVTAGANEREMPALIRKGISGIFLKHNSPALLVQGIRDAMKGKALFEQEFLKRVLEISEGAASETRHTRLTEREKQVLSLVFEGLTNKEVADRLQITESGVKSCLQHLFTKTGVRTRSQLVRVALEKYRDDL